VRYKRRNKKIILCGLNQNLTLEFN